jgi:hypothetical protein
MMIKKILTNIFLIFSLGYVEHALCADVKNVVAKQEGERIVFVYDLEGDSGSADVVFSLTVSDRTYKSTELHIEGDYGRVTVGRAKALYWNVLEDFSKGYAGKIDWEIYSPNNRKLAYIPNSETYDIGDKGRINASEDYVEAKGIGAVDPARIKGTNARPMALRAAQVDAYRNLLETVKGVKIDAQTTVRDFMTESDTINAKVSGLVKGAKVMNKVYLSDGTAEVTLRMELKSLLQVISSAKH